LSNLLNGIDSINQVFTNVMIANPGTMLSDGYLNTSGSPVLAAATRPSFLHRAHSQRLSSFNELTCARARQMLSGLERLFVVVPRVLEDSNPGLKLANDFGVFPNEAVLLSTLT